MPNISGSLSHVTGDPDLVTSIGVAAVKVRPGKGGIITSSPKIFKVENGQVSFPCEPGEAVLTLHYLNSAVEAVPILVTGDSTQTLESVVYAADASTRLTLSELEKLAAEIKPMIEDLIAAVPSTVSWPKGGLEKGVDLNEVTDSGFYQINTYSVAASALNMPDVREAINSGSLEVLNLRGKACVQRWTVNGPAFGPNMVFIRHSDTDGNWSLWEEVGSKYSWVHDDMDKDTDLNEVTTSGFHKVNTYSMAASLKNLPNDSSAINSGVLEVFNLSGKACVQRWTVNGPASGPNVTYTRHSDTAGEWTDWMPDRWHGAILGSDDHADNLTFPHAYAVNSGNMGGLPTKSPGTLEVLPAGSGMSTTTQRFTPRPLTDGAWVRSLTGKEWTPWQLAPSLDTVESLISDGVRDARDPWRRETLRAIHNLDDYTGASNQGIYGLTSSVGGNPLKTPGWVTVFYDSSSGRTRQTVTASSPTDGRAVYRTYSGGKWTDWRPDTPVGDTLKSTSNADDLIYPGYYPVGNTKAAGLPTPVLGAVQTLPAGTASADNVQLFVSSEDTPRMWARRVGGQWYPIGTHTDSNTEENDQTPTPGQITWGPVTETTRKSSEIAGALSHDRMVVLNGVGGPLRQSRDQGRTWEIVHQFPGQSIELVEPLSNGEILVATSGTVDGVPSTRRVYVSDGYDPANPSAAQWAHKLTGSARYVKFVDWSINQHGPIIVLAEYGPKGGMVWGSGTEPIPEGENARYAHLSLDHGKTWKKIFDLNEFLISRGQATLLHHIHGVAWDPYWDRIWLSFGDAMGGNGSNGVIYSDDLGATWEVAYHNVEEDKSEGWQVVGIQPMKNCVLFAGDMTPAGVMRIDRAGGKHREKWEFVEAWNYGESHKLLCHAIRYHETGRTETTLFGFSREGTASPSIIVGTHDGLQWNLIWESSDNASPGFRFMAGPTLTGELIAAINRSGTWTELRGKIDAY